MKAANKVKLSSRLNSDTASAADNASGDIHVYLHGADLRTAKLFTENIGQLKTKMFFSGDNPEENERIKENLKPIFSLDVLTINSANQYDIDFAVNKAHRALGGIDCAINNFRLPNTSTNILDCTPEFYNHEFRYLFLEAFLFTKYEISFMLGNRQSGRIFNLLYTGGAGLLKAEHAMYSLLCAIRGLSESITNSYREKDITVESYLITGSFDNDDRKTAPEESPVYSLSSPEGMVPAFGFPGNIFKSIRDLTGTRSMAYRIFR